VIRAHDALTRGLIRCVLWLGIAVLIGVGISTIIGLSHRVAACEAKIELLDSELLQFEAYD
jgi:hypothetical protein